VRDSATAELIDEITALRDALPPAVIEPVTCDAAPVATAPSVEDTAVPAWVEAEEFPDGVYRQTAFSSDELLDRGVPPEQAYDLGGGTSTMTFDNGAWRGQGGGSCRLLPRYIRGRRRSDYRADPLQSRKPCAL
jgi:hypothetical protein